MRHPSPLVVRLAATVLLTATALPAAAAPAVIEREFVYGADRFRLSERGGLTDVVMKGAAREDTPGRPDLPVLGEAIELPEGMRVATVEVVAAEGALLRAAARIGATAKARPGLEPVERTEADPAWFGRAGFPPSATYATLGYEGWMRGRRLAWLRVNPVRWDAASGRLERLARLKVRLRLEPDPAPAEVVRRERIVPEWEDDAAAAPGARRGGGAQPFAPTQIPSVLGSPVAYLIVTTDALAGEFQRLADWKTQSGVPAVVRTLSFVRQQYPFGTDDADRIRRFIRDAYSRWGTKWVLLGGDTEIIPSRVIHTTFFGGEDMPCDMYFSCLDGNWNADGDSTYGEGYFNAGNPGDACDMLPEVHVGRAPVTTTSDAQLFIDKVFTYSRTPPTDYQHSVLFFAEVLFPQNWQPGMFTSLDGAELAEDVLPSLQTNPAVHYARLYENHLDARWEPGAVQETAAGVLDSLDAGYNVAVHIGHGYRNVASCGDATIGNPDAMALANGDRLFNLYAINCTSNAIDFPCLGEAFLLAPHGGAVSNIGSTRFDFPHSGRAFQVEYFRLMYEDSVTAVGEAQSRQKLPFAPYVTSDNINRWTTTTLLLLGDPEMRQFLSQPRALTVNHPASHALSDTAITVNVQIAGQPLYGARVTVHKPGDDHRTVTTDGAGNAVLDFRPGALGDFYVTVTGFDCVPYQDTIPVVPAAAAALADGAPVIDDDNLGGTVGNADGFLDAGETVDLMVPVSNQGGSAALSVEGVLATTDGLVTMLDADVVYGTIAPAATANGLTKYRLSLPYTVPDQREIPFTLSLVDGSGNHYLQRFQVTARAPEPRHFSHVIVETSGNGNGIPEAGETVNYQVRLRNLGTGRAGMVTAKLRNHDGMATVTDSTATFGDIAPGQEVLGDAFTFSVTNNAAKLELLVSNSYGQLSSQTLDLGRPTTPTGLAAMGAQSSISLTWAHSTAPDLLGYNVYRSASGPGPYAKVTPVPTDRTSYYRDEGLAPLTPYHYKVTAVDSSGNESPQSGPTSASTNPPAHTIFPVEMERTTPASVAIEHVWQATQMDIVTGADILYAWRSDGTAPVDADGSAVTHGDFSLRGGYYAAGPSLAKLDGLSWSIVAASWDSVAVYAFDRQGQVRPGWPFMTFDPVWSCVAIGDLDNDGSLESVFGSNGTRIYALRADGTEWIDGDANPTTDGVFKILSAGFNPGTPGLADLDNNNELDIIYAGADGKLHAWRPNGTNLPGFPVTLGANIRSSVAIGYLDGSGDTQLDIVVHVPNDSLYVIRADGSRRPGFPVWVKAGLMSKNPSPALADMNADGFLDVVAAGTDGKIYVVDRNGAFHPAFASSRYSSLTSFASESSPVVADINGDGLPDVVMGDENGVLAGISGTGAVLPGFPIQLGGEVRGTAALCDCDHDGKSEIVVSSWDQNTYMWDYDFPFSPAGPPPWPQFHHDARRTGLASNPAFVDAPEPPPTVAAPARVELAPPVPNPARRIARITFAVPEDRAGEPLDLAIYDLAGRRLATLAAGEARAGAHAVDWDLASPGGGRVGGGIYFARLRLGATIEARKLVVMP